MEELETGGRAEDIPVDGEQGEDEAGHSDEREFDLGDTAQVSAEPSDEAGADGEQAEENDDRGNGYEIEVFVPSLRGRREVVASGCTKAEDAAEKSAPEPCGDASSAGKPCRTGLLGGLKTVFEEKSAADTIDLLPDLNKAVCQPMFTYERWSQGGSSSISATSDGRFVHPQAPGKSGLSEKFVLLLTSGEQ